MTPSVKTQRQSGVSRPLAVAALAIAWSVVMGALGKGDPIMAVVGTQNALLLKAVASALWVCALCVLSFAAGARTRLLPRGAKDTILLVVLGVVLGLDPGTELSRLGPWLMGVDVSLVIPGLALQAVGWFLTPLLTMLVLWMATEALGDGAVDVRSFAWPRAVGVSVLAGILAFVLVQGVNAALGTTDPQIRTMLINRLVYMEDIPDRLPVWEDMVLQLASIAGLAPALLVSARREG